jgi:hypothetical protein
VFCDSGIEGAGHQNQESDVRKEDISELFPETGRTAAKWSGRDDSGCENGAEAGVEGIVCGLISGTIVVSHQHPASAG